MIYTLAEYWLNADEITVPTYILYGDFCSDFKIKLKDMPFYF